MIQRRLALLAFALLIVLTAVSEAQTPTQIDQSEVARRLLTGNGSERGRALVSVQQIGRKNLTPQLRAALITALEREGKLVAELLARRERGDWGTELENPEFIAQLAKVVATFRDPGVIPSLAGALGSSPQAINALAEFGEPAASAVLQVLENTASTSVEMDALLTLRFMAEGVGGPLTAGTRERMRQVARERLTTRQKSITTVRGAIDLAVALNDAELRRIVQSLASDRNAVVALRDTDAEMITRTQRIAAERLAGVPPRPRHVSVEEYSRRWK
jgi:hypothetical protein